MKRATVLFVLLSVFRIGDAAIVHLSANGTMQGYFNPDLFSEIGDGEPWSVFALTTEVVPDQDPDPNVGTYIVLQGTITVGNYQFDMSEFPFSFRTINVYNTTGATTSMDRATLFVYSNVAAEEPLSIGPWVIMNFFVAMESPTDELVDDDSLGGLIGLTQDDLCFTGPCSASIGSRFGIQLVIPGEAGPITVRGEIESLSITAVPVPGALWLFGSALGLLGWNTRPFA